MVLNSLFITFIACLLQQGELTPSLPITLIAVICIQIHPEYFAGKREKDNKSLQVKHHKVQLVALAVFSFSSFLLDYKFYNSPLCLFLIKFKIITTFCKNCNYLADKYYNFLNKFNLNIYELCYRDLNLKIKSTLSEKFYSIIK